LLTLNVVPPAALPAAQPLLAAFRARHGREPSAYMPYGYEAMRVVLDCIRAAGAARNRVVDCFYGIRGRESVLGRYSIDRFGDATLRTFGVYGIDAGQLAFREVVDSSAR
jgi:branched-chain amino acid transport system substrate-binding protein